MVGLPVGSRRLLAKGLVRALVVVDRAEAVEASLLRDAVAGDGCPGLRLQRAGEALVGAVLLGARGLGAKGSDAEPGPPDAEGTPAAQPARGDEGRAVIGQDCER
jgi:hypothetical protein